MEADGGGGGGGEKWRIEEMITAGVRVEGERGESGGDGCGSGSHCREKGEGGKRSSRLISFILLNALFT